MADTLDSLMDSYANRPAGGAQQPVDPLDDAMDGYLASRQAQRTATVSRAVQVKPDAYAEQRRIAKQLEYPVAVVEATPDISRERAQTQAVERAASAHPVLDRKFGDEDFARLAHDDTPSLEKLGNWFANVGKYVVSHPSQSNTLVGDVAGGAAGFNRGAWGQLRAGAELFAPVLDPLAGRILPENPLRRVAAGAAQMAQEAGAAQKAFSPPQQGIAAGGVSSGVQSLTQNLLALPLAFLPGGQNAALAMMVGNTGGNAYQDARQQGVPMTQALPFAASQAAIEYATEKLPLSVLLKDLKAGASVLKTVGNQAVREVPGEQIATVLQDLNEWAVLPENKDKPFKDYLADRPGAAAQTLIATLIGTGGNVAIGKALEHTLGAAAIDSVQRDQAGQGAQTLRELFALTAEGKLGTRAPDTLQALVQEMADNSEGAPAQVRFDPRALADALQQSGMDETAIEQAVPGLLARTREALAAGDEVAVPIGEFLGVRGTPLEQTLMDHARVGDNELSATEAKDAEKTAAEDLQTRAQAVLEQAAAEGEQRTSAEAVKTKVLDRLNAAGRFTSDVNEAYATLHAAFFATMGARSGMVAEALFDQYNLGVQATGVGELEQITPEQAKETNVPVEMPTAPEFAEAVGNTPGAEVTPDGLRINLVRFQKPEQEGAQAIRTGVFYLPVKSANAKHYRTTPTTAHPNPYGGTEKFEGETLLRRPLFVKGATGGKAPEAAYDVVKGKGAMKALDQAVMDVVTSRGILSRTDPAMHRENIARFLKDHGADPGLSYEIAENSKQGNTLRYALQENVIAHAVRAAGYDSVVGFSKGKAGASISEVFDLREQTFPARGMDSSVHEAYNQSLPTTLDVDGKQRPTVNSKGLQDGSVALRALASEGNNQAVVAQALVDRLGVSPQQLADVFERPAVGAESDGLASVPPLQRVLAEVRAAVLDDPKILDAVVGSVAVDVVDNFAGGESAAKVALHDEAMLEDSPAFNADLPVAGALGDTADAVHLLVLSAARGAAELAGRTANAAREAGERGGAQGAGQVQGLGHDRLRQGPRATFSPSTNVITLLSGANLTSFLHESGHFFLEVMSDLAAMPNAPADITSDMNALLAWFGVQDLDTWRSMTLDQKRPYHERFAESWEQYMFEGQAPTAELQPLFSRFSAFMKSVYTSLKDFLAGRSSTPGGQATAGTFEQSAYHGTPHRDIEKFSTDKIGTGEGAQAFGYGLYFASKRGIAEFYREALAGDTVTVDGQPAEGDALRIAKAVVGGQDLDGVIAGLQADLATWRRRAEKAPDAAARADAVARDLAAAQSLVGKQIALERGGQLYEVEIPEDSEMLLWDKPLSEQPAKVREALGRAGVEQTWRIVNADGDGLGSGKGATPTAALKSWKKVAGRNAAAGVDARPAEFVTGLAIYRDLEIQRGSDKAASEALMAAGIKGIKYLDGTSRSAGDGSFNYVVFSGDDVAIKGQFYQSPDAPRNPLGLTPEVRAVFDRMLASDEQIKATQEARGLVPMFKDATEAGMAPAEFAAYLERNGKATSDAEHTLEKRSLRDLKWATGARSKALKALQKDAAEKRKAVESEVRAEVEAQPVYRAMRFLKTGRWTDVEGVEQRLDKGFKLNSDALAEIYQGAAPKRQGNPFKTFLGRYGVSKAVARDFAPGAKEQRTAMVPKFGPIFRANGLNLDMLAERAVEEGYLLEPDVQQLEELIHSVMRGERVAPQYDGSFEAQAQAMADRQRSLDEANADDPALSGSNVSEADAMRSLGFSEEEIEAATVDLTKLKGMTAANGMHPDLVADLLGYASGDQLVREVIDAQPLDTVVEGMTDQRMLERFGDISSRQALERAADEAVHNEARGRFLVSELKALMEGAGDPRLKATVDKAVDRAQRERTAAGNDAIRTTSKNALVKAAKLFADNLVNARKVRDLTPGQHTRAEARAAKAAMKALAAGDREATIQHKRDQVLQHYAARATLEAQDRASRIVDYLKKFEKPGTRKNLPPEYLDQIDKLLERVELRQRTNRELDKRASLAEWIAEQQDIGVEPDIPAFLLRDADLVSFREMTVSELRGLYDTVRQIEHRGREHQNYLTQDAKRKRAEINAEMADSIRASRGGKQAKTRMPSTRGEQRVDRLMSFGAAHLKVSNLVNMMDGHKDGGPLFRFFLRPTNERANLEAGMAAQATEAVSAIEAPWHARRDLNTKREVDGVFLKGDGRKPGAKGSSLSLHQALGIVLNTGNLSNLQRLTGGEGWTMTEVRAVVKKFLTADDLRRVQQVWDTFTPYGEQMRELEKRVRGVAPNMIEAEAQTWETADGQTVTLPGGYFPVRYDPYASERAAEQDAAEASKRQLAAAHSAATVRRGFTKGRVEEVEGRPLVYSLETIHSALQDTIHYLSWQEWLIDANRVLRSGSPVAAAIRETYGPHVMAEFKQWRDDIAAGSAGMRDPLADITGRLRQNVSFAGLAYNLTSAVVQVTGLAQTFVRLGPKWAARGVTQYVQRGPLKAVREVQAKSKFMAQRTKTRNRELNELTSAVRGQKEWQRQYRVNGMRAIAMMQLLVDTPTWLGAYEKAMAEGKFETLADGTTDDALAVSIADQAVADSQGGGRLIDLSGIERGKGGSMNKLWTVFYQFQNALLNLSVNTLTDPNKGAGRKAVDMLMLVTVPIVLTQALKDAFTPGDGGDDDWETWVRKLLGEHVGQMLGMFVVARELSDAAKWMVSGERSTDYAGPLGLRALADIYKFGNQLRQLEFDEQFARAANNLAGDLFGWPAALVGKMIKGGNALADGKTENPAALVTGYQEPR